MTALTTSPAWQNLEKLATKIKAQHMRDWFAADPKRAETFTQAACGIELDFSKNLITDEVIQALQALATECQVIEKSQAMFAGEIINHTEKRAVLHTALRNFSGKPVLVDGEDVMPEVLACTVVTAKVILVSR
jgi:glucose-6-phosphate isomerase